MILPPELVDEILIHLRHDNQALRNCSLIAKSWAYPSQKLLYARVRITPSTYQTWQRIASPASANLLRHVHSLNCLQFQSLHDLQEDYLQSFHRLQRLALHDVDNVKPDTVDLFSAFQNTLSSLYLFRVSLTLDAFIKLLCYLPKLRELYLSEPTFDSNHWTTPPPGSTPPRGSLSLCGFSAESTDILLRGLYELKPEYDGLKLVEVSGNSTIHAHSIISTCEKTLTHLTLGPCDPRTISTLENLSELRELVFTVSFLPPEELLLVSTITSTNIQKIAFNSFFPRDMGDQFWSSLDTALNRHVDRLRKSGRKHVLELEFQHNDFAKTVSDAGPNGFLPKFREKGRVTVSETVSGRILYRSDALLGSVLDSEGSKGSETTQAAPTPVVPQGLYRIT